MKLNKLYCNRPEIFPDIEFNDGLNVIYGEIRDPKNRDKTTHNIGKTTFIKLIDFCLLKGVSSYSFWRKDSEIFKEFTFFLELTIDNQSLITIRRSFDNDTRTSIKKHDKNIDFRTGDIKWDHEDITIQNAKDILDGYLDFDLIKPWDYRKITSYLLRTQDDYSDIFRLSQYAGKDIDWKPPLVQILGLDGHLAQRAYETDEEIKEIESKIIFLENRVAEFKDDPDRLNGLIQVTDEEINEFEDRLQDFDFKDVEDEINKDLVDDIESEISELNYQKYYLDLGIKSIKESLERKSNFSLKNTEKIFKEAGILFGEQVKKEYEDLVEFNKKITRERKKYLKIELTSKIERKGKVEESLDAYNSKRQKALSKIKEKETFDKYKKLGDELTAKKLTLLNLRSIKEDLNKLSDKKDELNNKKEIRKDITREMKKGLNESSDRYNRIKSTYNSIIKEVLNRTAIINTRVNSNGNYSFEAPFVDEDGISTSEDEGHTFKKLQCIAFDSSIVLNSLDLKFPKFVIHDGVLETLEKRVKLNLLELFRKQSSEGVQEIITVLDSHLPLQDDGETFKFTEKEIIRVLHDQGDEGKLFKMPSW